MTSAFVLDASVAACWAFHHETDPQATTAAARLYESDALVPAVWWYEIRNTLIVNERRGRIREGESEAFLSRIARLPIRIEREQNESELMRLARTYRLSVYDAAYLELAVRTGLELATLDKELRRAARACRVPLIA